MAGIITIFKYLTFVLIVVPFIGYNQTTSSYTTAGTYYWTAPCDVTSIQVECWGAGGGGGGASGNPSAGGGGSGGAYVKHTSIPVTPGTTYTITVGAGGTVSSSAAGNSGGVSWFSSAATIQAVGGAGGGLASSNSSTASGAAAVTTGNVCSVAGSVNYYGGAGGTGGASGASGGGEVVQERVQLEMLVRD